MFLNPLAASLAIAVFLAGLPAAVQAQQPINVEKWPDDVPCEILKKDADGTYEITVPWTRFFPDAHRHKIPEYPRDQILGPEVQGPDEIGPCSRPLTRPGSAAWVDQTHDTQGPPLVDVFCS
jgi:hypothetical protein